MKSFVLTSLFVVTAIGVGGYKMLKVFSGPAPAAPRPVATSTPAPTPRAPQAASPAPAQRVEAAAGTPRPAFDLRQEDYRGSSENVLLTSEGEYEVGEMSVHGFVESIRNRVVRIRQVDGRLCYLVAVIRNRGFSTNQAMALHTEAATDVPPKIAAAMAAASPTPSPSFSSLESARITASLKEPTTGPTPAPRSSSGLRRQY